MSIILEKVSGIAALQTSGSFAALLEHWAEARIDSPLQVIGRFDDAARQMITIGAIIQGAYVAAFGFGHLGGNMPGWMFIHLFAPLLVMIFCAGRVICLVPMQLEAFQAYDLQKRTRAGVEEAVLDSEMHKWCSNVDSLAQKKRWWLRAASMSFLVVSGTTLSVLGWIAMIGGYQSVAADAAFDRERRPG